jgi:hypothetical protein
MHVSICMIGLVTDTLVIMPQNEKMPSEGGQGFDPVSNTRQ